MRPKLPKKKEKGAWRIQAQRAVFPDGINRFILLSLKIGFELQKLSIFSKKYLQKSGRCVIVGG